ncbi:MAG: sulfatase [Verrucomicrobiaceae bacterium]|nr:sulfatase [Verrucomicrobiaceae bacterium]
MLSRGLVLFLVLLSQSSVLEAGSRPNVVLFLVDDMGWRDCGVFGSKYYETPRIDAFAKQAVRFTNAYAQPLCSPTRASLLTGKYSARHGITSATGHKPPQPDGFAFLPKAAPANQPLLMPESKNYLDPSEYTLAEALRDAGYRTAHIGKWHLGMTEPHWPEQQGFDVTFHCHPDPGPPGNYFSPYGVVPNGKPNGKTRVGNITDGPAGEYIVDRLADEAVKFIESSEDKPFFLNLWQYGVHGPWGHKEAYTAQFKDKATSEGQGNPIMASMLKSVDDSFGKVLDALDRLGFAENTIVIFNSDNGGNTHSNVESEAKTKKKKADDPLLTNWRKWAGNQPPTNNTPLRDGKGSLYEGGVRVPLMWRWPGKFSAGAVSEQVVAHIDLYPTVLELVGIKRKPEHIVDGASYASLLTTGRGAMTREALFNYFPHGAAGRGGVTVRAGNLKLIRWFSSDPADPARHELYDLSRDLGEQNNLAMERASDVARLDALIDRFLADTKANYPRPNPDFKGAIKKTSERRPFMGWVPKGCEAVMVDGVLKLTATGRMPFVAMTNLDMVGPLKLILHTKDGSGQASATWRLVTQEEFVAGDSQTTKFDVSPGTREIMLPVNGNMRHIRLQVPMPVALDKVEIIPATGDARTWDF